MKRFIIFTMRFSAYETDSVKLTVDEQVMVEWKNLEPIGVLVHQQWDLWKLVDSIELDRDGMLLEHQVVDDILVHIDWLLDRGQRSKRLYQYSNVKKPMNNIQEYDSQMLEQGHPKWNQ